MAENTPAIAAETPGSYKRFAQSDKISQGTTNAALSLNDYLPGQHVTGPNNNDIAATLAQVQAIPIGTATLSGNTYNVTISNYPNTATIYPGQKISVQFKNNAPTAQDTALNLSAFGKSLPMCARGIRMGRGSIKAGMVLDFIYWLDKWNADYDLVENVGGVLKYAESSSVYNKQSVDGALTDYVTYSVSGSFLGKVTQQYAKIKINISTPYSTTMIALHTRGGGLCLIGMCYEDADGASVTLYQRKLGKYNNSTFFYKVINVSTVEFYWKTAAYSTIENFSILSNLDSTRILEKSVVTTLPEGLTQL